MKLLTQNAGYMSALDEKYKAALTRHDVVAKLGQESAYVLRELCRMNNLDTVGTWTRLAKRLVSHRFPEGR